MFFPEFQNADELGDYLNRAIWYLPGDSNTGVEISYAADAAVGAPNFPSHSPEHEPFNSRWSRVATEALSEKVKSAHLVLVWQSGFLNEASSIVQKSTPLVSVDIDDPSAVEYGTWARARWNFLTAKSTRSEVVKESNVRLLKRIRQQPAVEREFALVMGTGPSFARWQEIDRRGGVVIACNSAVHDLDFLLNFRPDFIAFGDSAHHAGVTKRADLFRRDLQRALEALPNLVAISTDNLFGVLGERLSRFRDRIVWIPQDNGANFDLTKRFALPRFDSVLTNHMIPLASTLSKKVFLLGAEGTATTNKEDFWGHVETSGYERELESFHDGHPTFQYNRLHGDQGRKPLLDRYEASMARTIREGMAKGIKFGALMPSSVTALKEIRVSENLLKAHDRQGILSLRDFSQAL